VANIRYDEALPAASEVKGKGRKSLAVKMNTGDVEEVKTGFDKIKAEANIMLTGGLDSFVF